MPFTCTLASPCSSPINYKVRIIGISLLLGLRNLEIKEVIQPAPGHGVRGWRREPAKSSVLGSFCGATLGVPVTGGLVLVLVGTWGRAIARRQEGDPACPRVDAPPSTLRCALDGGLLGSAHDRQHPRQRGGHYSERSEQPWAPGPLDPVP